MPPCRRRRATPASSWTTSDRLAAAFTVSVVLVSSCSWCVAQQVIDIAPEDVARYYPRVANTGEGYSLLIKREPVTVLLRTDPESEFEMTVWTRGFRKEELTVANGWNPDCKLRFECEQRFGKTFQRSMLSFNPTRPRMWTVYEKGGSEPFSQLTQEEGSPALVLTINQAEGTTIRQSNKNIPPVPLKDCVLENKSLGDRLIYNFTFYTDDPQWVPRVKWNSKNTVFVRLEEPTTTTEESITTTDATTTTTEEPTTKTKEPTTTPGATDRVEASAPPSSSTETPASGTTTSTKRTQKSTPESGVNTPSPPSHSTTLDKSDTTPSEPSAAGSPQLGPFVAAVVIVQSVVSLLRA